MRWNLSKKIIIIAVLIVLVIGAGVWYYLSQIHPTSIGKIVNNPKVYIGKEVTIEGEVTDRTAFFGVLKFYKVRDKTGEITVVTKKSLPDLKSNMSVKGSIEDSFSLGDQKLVVLEEESIDDKYKNK